MENVNVVIKKNLERTVNYKKLMKIMIILFIISILILEIFSVYIVLKFSHPDGNKRVLNFENYGIENYEKVNFKSEKGNVDLSGYIIKNNNSKKTIIISHGYGDNKFMDGGKTSKIKVNHLELAKTFNNNGYNTFIFDFRGHGDYLGKNAVTIGFNEQNDLLGAIKFIKSKGIGENIGLIGFSMGAATSLSVLDKTKDINFVIADSPFSELKGYLKSNMKHWTGLPNFPFVPMIMLNFKLIYGVDYSKVSPLNSIKKSNIPILMIHGKKDITIPYTESVKMEKSLKNSKSKLVLFDASSHIDSYFLYKDKYEKVIKEFLTSIKTTN